jgi:putative phage-type endonuclease
MTSNVLAKTKDMDRVEWLEWRRKGLGGSDIGAICGLNKWKSPVGVYLEKTGELKDEGQSESAYWGNVLEDVVAKEFEIRTGKKVKRKNAILQHPEYPWMIANVDRVIVGEKAILECKTTSTYNNEDWQDDKVPESYILQVQHYLAVSGLKKAYIACLVGGNRFICKEIERDEELIDHLIGIEKDFWKLVEDRTPPTMDGSEASSELLSRLYPKSIEGAEILLPSEARYLSIKREELIAQEKDIEGQINEIENKLKQMLETNESGLCDGYKISWKSQSRSGVDSKKLKAEQPEIYKQYVKETSFRKFEIKPLKA